MLAREIIDLGLAAFERGYLDRERLLEILSTPASPGQRPEDFWQERGLSAEQIDQITLSPSTLSAAQSKPSSDGSGLSIVITSSVFRDSNATPELAPNESPTRVEDPEPDARFQQLRVLGVGGMGEVLEYEDTRVGRHVAVKRIKPGAPQPERAAALLEREARVTGRLEHPNIVPLYDMGTDPARGPFYMMRLLSHPTLAQVLTSIRRRDPGTMADYSLHRLIRCFVQVCRAVDYAHSRGVIHCDLKPANILVGPYGEVLVVDWGFCHILGERRTQRGGTPGFLAPEQLDPEVTSIDARTDVFALGAMLYDILCLQHAFPILPMAFMLDAVKRGAPPLPPPVPPSQRAPDRKISAELDEICLRALSFAPADRYRSAHDLADALDAYLEGTKEQERRLNRARELTEQGDLLAANYRELIVQTPERLAELNRLRVSVSSWSQPAEKQALWDAEDRESVLQSVALRTFQAAIATYEYAIDEVPNFSPARLGLARIYWEALQRAQDRRAEGERIYLEGMVNQYDDGSLQRLARTVAGLSLDIEGPVSKVSLWLTNEVGRRLLPVREQVFSGSTIRADGLDPGSYVAILQTPNGDIRVPLLLRSGIEVAMRIDVSRVGALVPGEVLVPAGEALLGGHETSLLGGDLQRIEVPAFFLEVLPVTFARYLAFLDTLAGEGTMTEQLLPRSEGGEPYWERRHGVWQPVRARRWGSSADELMKLPVVGVDLQGALAFARWASEVTGLAYRLPTENEWEKAARGVDGRAYPWGDHFDASFCKVRESRPSTPRPEPPGSFPSDVSPYGVRDMAGSVADWVLPSIEQDEAGLASNQIVSRGGAWCDWRLDCHTAARRPYMISERSERVGFRLARSVADETAVSSSHRHR